MKMLQRLEQGYRFTAFALLGSLLMLVVLNGIFFFLFWIKDYFALDYVNPVSEKYGHEKVTALYQGLDEHEINNLLKETWTRPYSYEPFTQFKESLHQGVYVNVSSAGYRVTKNQGPWPPQAGSLNIFLFGGSTTFGYGVADEQTIASHLQNHLTKKWRRDVRVYNFGRGHYYSTQERILYEELLASGFVPDMAIFIDGLNDFYYHTNEPLFADQFREWVATGGSRSQPDKEKDFFARTALARAIKTTENPADEPQKQLPPADYSNPQVLDQAIKRYHANKQLIEAVSAALGVNAVFVWQPVPMYHFDEKYHPFAAEGYGDHSYAQPGYTRMAALVQKNPPGRNFLWCADIQTEAKAPLYIDKVHYSAEFSQQFAQVIADFL